MGQAITFAVQFPTARWEIMGALASLSSREHQRTVWPVRTGGLDHAVHTLFDDWVVLPDPRPAIGAFLLEGPEIGHLLSLGAVLDSMISDMGDAPDADYLADTRWADVVSCAEQALSAMVLAGAQYLYSEQE